MSGWYESSAWLNAPRHIVSAAVVAVDELGRILLVRSPRRGWEMPGGQAELGETLEAAAIREAKEESGIDVTDLVFCGIFQSVERGVVNACSRGAVVGARRALAPSPSRLGSSPLTRRSRS
jgi:8-oxo-dGTP pyrophosphatase MutT (NUDIX family)